MVHRAGHTPQGFPGCKIREVQLGQKVVIYCRVSTADQSCARQEQDLLAYADRAGFEVVEIHREVSSGTKDQRTERKKVMALAQDRRTDEHSYAQPDKVVIDDLALDLGPRGRRELDVRHDRLHHARARGHILQPEGLRLARERGGIRLRLRHQ